MKVHVIVFDKNNAFPYTHARYDHDKRLVEVFGKKFIRMGVVDRFHVDPDHIYNERGKFGRLRKCPLICVDNATRKSVDPKTYAPIKANPHPPKEKVEIASSVKMHSDEPIDEKERNKLNYLIEKSFWDSLMTKFKTPLKTLLIHMFFGIGVWHLIRMILIVLGLVEGVI